MIMGGIPKGWADGKEKLRKTEAFSAVVTSFSLFLLFSASNGCLCLLIRVGKTTRWINCLPCKHDQSGSPEPTKSQASTAVACNPSSGKEDPQGKLTVHQLGSSPGSARDCTSVNKGEWWSRTLCNSCLPRAFLHMHTCIHSLHTYARIKRRIYCLYLGRISVSQLIPFLLAGHNHNKRILHFSVLLLKVASHCFVLWKKLLFFFFKEFLLIILPIGTV